MPPEPPSIAGIALCTLVGSLLGAAALPAQEGGDQPIPGRVKIRVGTPLLVSHAMEISFVMTMVREEGETRSTNLDFRSEQEFIDEFISVTPEKEESTRTYLRAAEWRHSQASDPGLEGVTMRYRREGTGRSLHVDGDRWLPKRVLQDHLTGFDSIGIWTEFPQTWTPDERIEVDLRSLAPLLLGCEVRSRSAIARLELASVDRNASIATLRGEWVTEGVIPASRASPEIAIRNDGALEIRFDFAAGRVLELAFDGTVQSEAGSEGQRRMTGSGKLRSRLVTRIPEDPAALRAHPPQFPIAMRYDAGLSLRLDLPSHWVEVVGGSESAFMLRRSVEKRKGDATILLFPITAESAVPDVYFRFIEQAYAARGQEFEAEEVESTLGKGRAYTISEEQEGRKIRVRTEVYPYRERWVHLQLVGDVEAVAAALDEFIAARPTLRVWNPPPPAPSGSPESPAADPPRPDPPGE
jgi:hypothetical protein